MWSGKAGGRLAVRNDREVFFFYIVVKSIKVDNLHYN